MKDTVASILERGRLMDGSAWSSTPEDGLAGAFHVMGPTGAVLRIISSGVDMEWHWEHVSVSTERRTPTWSEMCFVKDLFWGEEEAVMQVHPPRSEYVNYHPHSLAYVEAHDRDHSAAAVDSGWAETGDADDMSFDPAVYDLCVTFLLDTPEKDNERNRDLLAQHIQDEIEDFIAFMLLPNGRKGSDDELDDAVARRAGRHR